MPDLNPEALDQHFEGFRLNSDKRPFSQVLAGHTAAGQAEVSERTVSPSNTSGEIAV
jgi:hypothetical protein